MREFSTPDWIVMMSPKSHPRELVVEITTLCNMNCIHCFRKAALDLKPCSMDLKFFKSILSEAIENNVGRIVFSGWGEPLIHPEIQYMIKMCKDLGLEVAINTNGSRIDELIDTLVKYVDEIYISLDAATARIYNIVRQPTMFSGIIQSLSKLVSIKQVRGQIKPVIKILFTVTFLNIVDVEYFLKLAVELGVNEVVFTSAIPYSDQDIGCLSSIKCIEDLSIQLKKALEEFKEFSLRITAPQTQYTASCPFASKRALFIRCDGVVTPCIHYAYSWTPNILGINRYIKRVVLGYIGKDRLINIWRNRYAKIFYRLYFKRIPSCLACSLVEYCGKTRENTADCLGGEPNCGHCPYYHSLSYCPL